MSMILHHRSLSFSTKQRRRLRLAFRVLCFITFSKKQLIKKIVRSLSHVSIEIHSNNSNNIHNNETSIDNNDNNETSINQKTLTSMTREKDREILSKFGGPDQLATMLASNKNILGVSSKNVEDLAKRKRIFGAISSHKKPLKKPFYRFVVESFLGIPTLVQLVFAVFSLGFDMELYGKRHGWYDGAGILISVFLTVIFSATIKFLHNSILDKVTDKISKTQVVRAFRDGCWEYMSIFELVVGDVILLKMGDCIPCDGLLLNGSSLKVTKKFHPLEEELINKENPFLLCGSKVFDGQGKMLVTSLFGNTLYNDDEEVGKSNQPLQSHIKKLKYYIIGCGMIVAVIHVVALELRYFSGLRKYHNGNKEFKGRNIKRSDIMSSVFKHISGAITIAVASYPEGLPLAMTLTLFFSMKMMSSRNVLMKLSRWEDMGLISVICIDKTAIFSFGVPEFWVGKVNVRRLFRKKKDPRKLYELLQEGVGLNSSGSSLDKWILKWGVSDLGIEVDELSTCYDVRKVVPCNNLEQESCRFMALRKRDHSVINLHLRGPGKQILAMCCSYYDLKGELITMSDEDKKGFEGIIDKLEGDRKLKCIAFAYKEIHEVDLDSTNPIQINETGLSLIGLLGLNDREYQPGILKAFETCNNAGVSVKLITGEDISIAKKVASDCGILNSIGNQDEAVITGSDFRDYSAQDRLEMVDSIRVMSNSSTFDKLLMVTNLRKKGHVVAIIDDGTTNNASLIEEADIGIILGTESTQVIAKASNIVVVDGKFDSIVTILRWGRCMLNNIQKVIQVQLTITSVGCITSFIIAATSGNVPILWTNMMVDTLAALALATERPTEKDRLMNNEGMRKFVKGSIVTKEMWRNIIGQTLYQVSVLLTLQYKGKSIFGVDDGERNTLIFNCFVLFQVFNECNARRVNKKNIFDGILENIFFLGIIGITIILQVILVEIFCKFSGTERLNIAQWAACLSIGALSLPVGWLVKCIPIRSRLT